MTAAPLLSEELGADGARDRWFLSAVNGATVQLCREHLDRPTDDLMDDLLDPAEAFAQLRHAAETLQAWYDAGCVGARPPGRLRPHHPERLPSMHRPWAIPVYRWLDDPDGRAIRDRIRHRP